MDFDLNKLKQRVQPKKGKRQTFVVPKRSFIQKYPKLSLFGAIGTGLAIFFSRTIYDAFFRTEFAPYAATADERRVNRQKAWRIWVEPDPVYAIIQNW